MKKTLLSMGRTLEELESNLKAYFDSDKYVIEGHYLMRLDVHGRSAKVGGYFIRQRKDCYQCWMIL